MVYVDDLMDHGWRLGPSCHLFTDVGPLDGLHAFARRLGLRREWFQHRPGKLPHYDLTRLRRHLALRHGAAALDRRETVKRIRAWREAQDGVDRGDEGDCSACGGDGVVALGDHPELWGEDCFSEEDRLVPCPQCSK